MIEVKCPYCGTDHQTEEDTKLFYCTCCSKEFKVVDIEAKPL